MDSYITDIDALLDQFEKDDSDSLTDNHLSNKENKVIQNVVCGDPEPCDRMSLLKDHETTEKSQQVNPTECKTVDESLLDNSNIKSHQSVTEETLEISLLQGLTGISVADAGSTSAVKTSDNQPVEELIDRHSWPNEMQSFLQSHSSVEISSDTSGSLYQSEADRVGLLNAVPIANAVPISETNANAYSAVLTSPVDLTENKCNFHKDVSESNEIPLDQCTVPFVHESDDQVIPSQSDSPVGSLTEPVEEFRTSLDFDSVLAITSDNQKVGELTGLQTALWSSTSDISDAELEQFLNEIASSPEEAGEIPTFSNWNKSFNGSESFSLVPKSVALDTENFDAIRLSPPIPMALVDVSDEIPGDWSLRSLTSPEVLPLATSKDIASASTFLNTDPQEGVLIRIDDISSSPATPETATFPPVEEEMIPDTEHIAGTSETEISEAKETPFNDENAPVHHESIIFSAENLGKLKPEWVPDDLAPICMLCGIRFSLVRRRHHCRACGTVICSSCGNYKAKLEYLDFREDRVCALCNETFEYKNGITSDPDDSVVDLGEDPSPSPVVIESLQTPPPPGVLKRQDRPRNPDEQKSVVFFDGIRPGGDLMESDFHGNGRRLALMNAKRQRRSPGAVGDGTELCIATSPPKSRNSPKRPSSSHVVRLFVNRDVFPVMDLTKDGHYVLHEHPDMQLLRDKFSGCPSEPVDFFVNACLRVSVQMVELKCCTGQVVWSYATSGMRLVGQDEIVVLLTHQEGDFLPPRDVLVHLNEIFLHAKEGRTIGVLGHSIVGLNGYSSGFLGNRNNAGFLFIRRSFQCIDSLRLPEPPYLFGILMTKWEIPWAKLFPLRLVLRLGAEFRYYPCPLISYRNRKPVYEDIGHTLMNLLCDFRNFQYHLPCVEDSECCMEKGVITLRFPKYKYDQVVKACQSSNENVLPIGMDFSKRADATLVCIQNLENGQYETQAISMDNNERKVTGASFIIFNASLKSMDGSECRATVVEDGIMAQITLKGLQDLKAALKAMKSVTFKSVVDVKDPSSIQQEVIVIEWTNAAKTCNSGVRSPIDGKDMTEIESRRVTLKHSMDFVNGTLCVRCTEVFLADEGPSNAVYREELDLSRLAENLAMATCSVLRNHLYDYRDSGSTKIGLRVSLGPDLVEYEIGSKNERFPPEVLVEFDDKIMPLINECARLWNDRPRLDLELVFRIFQH